MVHRWIGGTGGRWIGGTGGRWTGGSVAPVDRGHRWIGGTGGSVAPVAGGPVAPVAGGPVAVDRWRWTGGGGPVAVDRWNRSVASVNDARCLNAYPIGVPIGPYTLPYRGTHRSLCPTL
jgi:hypothetical protein